MSSNGQVKPKKANGPLATGYLILYNACCIAGWAFVDYLIVNHFMQNGFNLKAASSLYPVVEQPLKIVQTAAFLEILHAAAGLVPSSAFVTFVQVMSRVMVLWGMVHLAPAAQSSPFFSLMVASWAAVEVPRYFFYLVALVANPPYWLTWLRYSLFIVLYPSGITGEIGCLWNSLDYVKEHGEKLGVTFNQPNDWNLTWNHYYLLLVLLALYVPGSPFMIANMWKARSKALAKEAEKAKKA